jgi:POT family proton-dependent oligopeptide transporter
MQPSHRDSLGARMGTRTASIDSSAVPGSERQPGVLYMLFATEAWERFSYYGMRAIFVLYMVNAVGFSEDRAALVYGLSQGLVYLTPLAGGLIADRLLGYRRSILLGGVIMAAGQFCLSTGAIVLFYLGLGLLIIGNGFFKPNVTTIVGTLYAEGDPRRDRGFTIFYMGINLGALLSPIVCGQLLGENPAFGFRWGFRAAGIGMIAGTLTFLVGQRWLGIRGLAPRQKAARADPLESHPAEVSHPLTTTERKRVIALFVMVAFVIFFWMAFEQAGSTMTLFADQSTNRDILGFEAKASLFQSVNPVLILILAPLVSLVWKALNHAKREPSTPMKMVLGLGFLGFGFVPLIVASAIAGPHGRASWVWLVLAYFLHTVGELCLSPIGLSLVTKLAPTKYAALLMGSWFLANVVGNFLVGLTGALYTTITHVVFFGLFFVTSFGAALILFLSLKPIQRLMGGVH